MKTGANAARIAAESPANGGRGMACEQGGAVQAHANRCQAGMQLAYSG